MATFGTFTDTSVLTAAELNSIGVSWTSFTPTWTNVTTTSGTNAGYYLKIGKTTFFVAKFTLGASSAITGVIKVDLPATAARIDSGTLTSYAVDSSAGDYYPLFPRWVSTSNIDLRAMDASGTYVKQTATSSSVPMTWATSDMVVLAGVYEAA